MVLRLNDTNIKLFRCYMKIVKEGILDTYDHYSNTILLESIVHTDK